MPRNRISDDARQIVFNVLLYFEKEAHQFKKQENGYFQKVHARVTEACCVSRKFINTILKEEKFIQNYTPQPIRKRRRLKFCDEQDYKPRTLFTSWPTAIQTSLPPTGLPPAPAPLLTPNIPPAKSFYSKIEPPPLVPIVKRRQSSPSEPPKPIPADLDALLPPIVNTLDALLPPIINNLSTLPSLTSMVNQPKTSPDLPVPDTSPYASPYRYTPELFIDEDRDINYSDNEDIGPISCEPLCFECTEKMICEFGNDGELG